MICILSVPLLIQTYQICTATLQAGRIIVTQKSSIMYSKIVITTPYLRLQATNLENRGGKQDKCLMDLRIIHPI